MLDPAILEVSAAGARAADEMSEAAALTVNHRQERQLNALIGRLGQGVLASPENCERFQVVFLDANKRVLCVSEFGDGYANGVHLSLRDLFQRALGVGARGIILAHNHPSGDCRPSACDFDSTIKIAQVAKYLEIEIIDHLIFTENSVYSMRMGGVLRS